MNDSPLWNRLAANGRPQAMRVLNAVFGLAAPIAGIVLIYVMNGQLDHDPYRNEAVLSDEALLALAGLIVLSAARVALNTRAALLSTRVAGLGVALASIPYGAVFLLPQVVDDPVVQLMNLTAIFVLNAPLIWARAARRRRAGV